MRPSSEMANADMSPTGRPLNVERAAISLVFAVRGIVLHRIGGGA
jgi:hypothetical protein